MCEEPRVRERYIGQVQTIGAWKTQLTCERVPDPHPYTSHFSITVAHIEIVHTA